MIMSFTKCKYIIKVVKYREIISASSTQQMCMYNIFIYTLLKYAQQTKYVLHALIEQEYLSSLKVVHRDLACRNILIGKGKRLRITDFGMSQMDDVYVKTTKGRLPLKWMAIESIIDREFTSASDVWSFGIVL